MFATVIKLLIGNFGQTKGLVSQIYWNEVYFEFTKNVEMLFI